MPISRRIGACAAVLAAMALYGQRGFRQRMEEEVPIPANPDEKTEYVFARLQYNNGGFGRGYWRGSWSTDYPAADRHFLSGVQRLSRIHARSMELVISPDSDDVYMHPWIYAVEVGRWTFSDSQALRMRNYLLRGGFLMVDDFHGTYEWAAFLEGMQKIFPDRPIVDLENTDPIFHVLYDLDDRFQVPGIQILRSGVPYEKDGFEPKWRAIFDDKGRVLVAICHNMDLGDAWEWADAPQYPERYASLAYRVGLNYIIYAMTH